jgi:hypothetical protein
MKKEILALVQSRDHPLDQEDLSAEKQAHFTVLLSALQNLPEETSDTAVVKQSITPPH